MPVHMMQPTFAGGELSPGLYGRVDLGKYRSGLAKCVNMLVRPHGGVTNRPGLRFIGAVADHSRSHRLVPFAYDAEQSHVLEFGHQTMRVITDGAYITETAKAITVMTSPATVTVPGHGFAVGDDVAVAGAVGTTGLNGRTLRVDAVSGDDLTLTATQGTAADMAGDASYGGSGTVARIYQLQTPYSADDLAGLDFVQAADIMYLAHRSHAPQKLARSGHAAWTLTQITFAPGIGAPTGVAVTRQGSATGTTYTYVVTAVAAESGEESLPSAEVSVDSDLTSASTDNRVTWGAVSGADRYVVYRESNGVFGFLGETEAVAFTDTNIEPDRQDTPPKARNPFVGAGNYPGAVCFFEQRLCFAGSTNQPQTIWMSNSANFENFSVANPSKDDDAITVTLYGREVNSIRYMVALDDLLVFTNAAEWRISGTSSVGYVTPSSIERKAQSEWGAAAVAPVVVGNSVLFVQNKGSSIRDLTYSLDVDGYAGNDLSIFAGHLFETRRIVAWAFTKVPLSTLWCVTDDGLLFSLAYLREHLVWGWSQHDVDGFVESICPASESREDVAYLVVRRQVGGADRRYVERLSGSRPVTVEASFFLDSGLSYDGQPAARVGGLWHLEGRTVSALVDGQALHNLTVVDGGVDLDADYGTVHVGLPYTSQMQTLPLDLEGRSGTGSGRIKRIVGATVRLERSRGVLAGPEATRLTDMRRRSSEPFGTAPSLFTGDLPVPFEPSWTLDGTLMVEQRDPLPLTVLAVMPEVELGD